MRYINCRRVTHGLVLLVIAAWSGPVLAATLLCPAAPLPQLRLPATEAALAAGRPVTIVALGSSSTAGTGASRPDRTYPARLQAMLRAAWPEASVRVINRGIGGQEANDMEARIGTDVLPEHPTVVIWQAGANEALQGMDPGLFQDALDRGVRRIDAVGSDIILMDNQVAPRIVRAPHNRTYDRLMAREARARDVSLFSRNEMMLAWQESNPSEHDMVGPDGLHLTDHGYACIAASLARAIEEAVDRPLKAVSARK